jgi:hypothetical protein
MARIFLYVLGVVLTLGGLVSFAMDGSLFNFFSADNWLSTLWVAMGVVTLAVAVWTPAYTTLWGRVAGIILAALAVIGAAVSGPVLHVFTNTTPDNALHAVLAVAFLFIGFASMGTRLKSAEAPPIQPTL